MTLEPIYVNVAQAADALGIERSRVYELLNSGELQGAYDRSKRLVYVKSIRAWAATLPTERDAS